MRLIQFTLPGGERRTGVVDVEGVRVHELTMVHSVHALALQAIAAGRSLAALAENSRVRKHTTTPRWWLSNACWCRPTMLTRRVAPCQARASRTGAVLMRAIACTMRLAMRRTRQR